MNTHFYDGQELQAIYFGGVDDEMISSGIEPHRAVSIKVTMENGGQGLQPWAIVMYRDGHQCKWNLTQCKGVEF